MLNFFLIVHKNFPKISRELQKFPGNCREMRFTGISRDFPGGISRESTLPRARLNIWSQSVSDEILAEWSSKCDDDLSGDIFSWNYVQNSIKDFVNNEVPSRVGLIPGKSRPGNPGKFP